ncbi:Ulp1 protease [Gracilaria domingensis]|nr:Ulp1 protease [Gracilaria domingensis]
MTSSPPQTNLHKLHAETASHHELDLSRNSNSPYRKGDALGNYRKCFANLSMKNVFGLKEDKESIASQKLFELKMEQFHTDLPSPEPLTDREEMEYDDFNEYHDFNKYHDFNEKGIYQESVLENPSRKALCIHGDTSGIVSSAFHEETSQAQTDSLHHVVEDHPRQKYDDIGIQSFPEHVKCHSLQALEIEKVRNIAATLPCSPNLTAEMGAAKPLKRECEVVKNVNSPEKKQSNSVSNISKVTSIDYADIGLSEEFVRAREDISTFCAKKKWKERYATKNTFAVGRAKDIREGSCIEAFWNLDLQWYRGTVQTLTGSGSQTKIDVLYDDGDRETMSDLSNSRWRRIERCEGRPRLTFEPSKSRRSRYDQVMRDIDSRKREKDSQHFLAVKGEFCISSSDYSTLKEKEWLSDVVIEAFILRLIMISRHKADKRFMYISSFATSDPNMNEKYMHGILFHDIDGMIWPIHVVNHWMLCYVDMSTREFVLLDPCNVHSRSLRNAKTCQLIKNVLHRMGESYNSKYGDSRPWKAVPSQSFATRLNLPAQPHDNASDCGVLVCYYAWAILVGGAFSTKFSELKGKEFDSLMKKARVMIGGYIAEKK